MISIHNVTIATTKVVQYGWNFQRFLCFNVLHYI